MVLKLFFSKWKLESNLKGDACSNKYNIFFQNKKWNMEKKKLLSILNFGKLDIWEVDGVGFTLEVTGIVVDDPALAAAACKSIAVGGG